MFSLFLRAYQPGAWAEGQGASYYRDQQYQEYFGNKSTHYPLLLKQRGVRITQRIIIFRLMEKKYFTFKMIVWQRWWWGSFFKNNRTDVLSRIKSVLENYDTWQGLPFHSKIHKRTMKKKEYQQPTILSWSMKLSIFCQDDDDDDDHSLSVIYRTRLNQIKCR